MLKVKQWIEKINIFSKHKKIANEGRSIWDDHYWPICKKCRNKGSRLCRACHDYSYLEDEIFPGTPQAETIRRKSPWISVKDRLPELIDGYSSGHILFYGHSDPSDFDHELSDVETVDRLMFGYYYRDIGTGHLVFASISDDNDFPPVVKCWIPIPEPPKKGDYGK